MIKYVYEIDYPVGEKRKYLDWVRSIADIFQAPGELKGLASYDNVFSATSPRVVEVTFESLEEAAGISTGKRMLFRPVSDRRVRLITARAVIEDPATEIVHVLGREELVSVSWAD